MAKPKPPRDSVFGESEEEAPRIPFVSAKAVNTMYETGFAGLPAAAFEDPVEKENEALKGQVADLMEQIQSRTSDLLAQDGTLIVQGFQLTPTGLIAPEEITQESWIELGRLLARLEGSLQWLIGDWIVYGQAIRWGDIPELAKELGFSDQTLHDYSYVARKVEFSIRIENLSFAHHRLVTTLTPEYQSYALQYASQQSYSVADFRRWIKMGMPPDGIREELSEDTSSPRSTGSSYEDINRKLGKFMKRDLTTLKVDEKEEFLERLFQMQRIIAETVQKVRGS